MEPEIWREACWEPTNSGLRQSFSVSSVSLSYFFDAANSATRKVLKRIKWITLYNLLLCKPIGASILNQPGYLFPLHTWPCGCTHVPAHAVDQHISQYLQRCWNFTPTLQNAHIHPQATRSTNSYLHLSLHKICQAVMVGPGSSGQCFSGKDSVLLLGAY